jgi:protoporphyrinogen/coproporphyrinogen III oxidase
MSEVHTTQVAIIGGGISGLSTAWYLQQHDVQYTVLERANRWGGKIMTEEVDTPDGTFVIEAGPDSFLTQKPWGLQLARELGLDEQILGTNDAARCVLVLNKGKLTPMPDGVLLIVPTRFKPFVFSRLISPIGKLRIGLDLFIPRKSGADDETLASFVQRRLGSEALDKIAEPMMSGIYNAEAERQSLLATFPRFRTLEREHGSLIRAMLASQRSTPNGHAQQGKAASMFVSLKRGTEGLIRALIAKLTGDLRLNTGVQRIEPLSNDRYQLTLDNGDQILADAVVMAVPAHIAANLIRPLAPQAANDLESIRYVSTGTISLAFRREDVEHPLDGFGVVIPRSEQRQINAVTWSSTKFDHRVPTGYVLMRIFFGGSRTPAMMNLDDEALLITVRRELESLLNVKAAPVQYRIYRWWQANPQYDVGHLDRVARIESALPRGIYITGSPYRGVGIPDCVHQAQDTAQRLIKEQNADMLAVQPTITP